MKRLLFIYNPHAGKGQIKNHLSQAVDIFTKAGWLVTIRPTQGKGDATEVASELGASFDRVVCCGGDGTLHETMAGLMPHSHRPPVGYLPAGTTNDFSKNLHLPRSFDERADRAAGGVLRPVDVGQFNHEYFVYVAAFGIFTDVAYDTPQPFKNMFGHLAYLLEGVTRLGNIQSYHLTVEHDGEKEEGDFIFGMVSNTVSVGGFRGMNTGVVHLDDGLFEVVLVRKPTTAAQLQSLILSLVQMTPEPGGAVLAFRTEKLTVTSPEPLPWTLDGEYGGDPKVAEITNLKQAVRIAHGK